MEREEAIPVIGRTFVHNAEKAHGLVPILELISGNVSSLDEELVICSKVDEVENQKKDKFVPQPRKTM